MNIILFFTYDISLKDWEISGLLSREILLYKELNKKYGLTFTFITYGNSNDEHILMEIPFIKVVPVYSLIKRNKNKFIRFLKSIIIPFKIKQHLKASNLIKTNQLMGSWVAIISKIIYKKPLLLRTGYDILTFSKKNNKHPVKIFFYFALTKISLFFSDLYLVSSNVDKKYLTKKTKKSQKINVRPNWVLENSSSLTKKRYSKKIIAVGRLEQQKNYGHLISSFSKTDYEINLYGTGTLESELRDCAIKQKTKLNIHKPVPNNELLEILTKYKYFISTSLFEGNPKVVLEAMAAGCVVIALENKNISEIIKNDFNGILVNENSDIPSLLEKINEKKWMTLSTNALLSIKNDYLIENIITKEYEDYKLITESNVS